MQQNEFRNAVKDQIDIDENDRVDEIIETVLGTLSARISDDEAAHLAAQLPEPYKTIVGTERRLESFNLEQFFIRIAGKLRIGRGPATRYAQVVLNVLEDAVTTGELRDVVAQLPDEFAELFAVSVPEGN